MLVAVAERGLRERKKAGTREALAAATLRLAVEHGWEQVTVEAITAAADVSYRTFFNHFSAKEEALLVPAGPDQPRLSARLRAQPPGTAVLDAVRAALHEELAELERDPAALRDRMTVVLATPSLIPRLVEMGSADEREMAQAIAERTGQDVEADLYPALLAAVVSAAVRVTLWRWQQLGGTTGLVTVVDEALDALAGGLPPPLPAA
jgi:AcrR family transcriptional regulator